MFTCAEMAEHFRVASLAAEELLTGVVVEVVANGSAKARSLIGEDQSGWDPLSAATIQGFRHMNGRWIEGKEALGYSPPDNPLLRTGNLRDSIVGIVPAPLTGEVGSDQQEALWQELGTAGALYPIPPRPFLARGLMEAVDESIPLFDAVALKLLTPGEL